MRDYKLLLAGLILLLLIIFIAIFTWLWTSNRKNMDPLPIMANDNDASTATADDENAIAKSTLHIQAEDKIQVPLDAVITTFQSRYPHVQIVTNYVNSAALLTLSDSEFADSHRTDDERASYVVNTDIIIANSKLSKERLSPLQEQLKAAQDKHNQSKGKNNSVQEETAEDGLNENNETDTEVATQAKSDNTDTRSLISFSYALQDTQAVDGVVLTPNPAAINFRNFLLSSTGQDILSQHDYNNIDGYKNDMDNLFKPSSGAKQATGELKVDVADALSNGK